MPIDVLGLTVYEDPHLGKLRITQNTLDTLGYGKKKYNFAACSAMKDTA